MFEIVSLNQIPQLVCVSILKNCRFFSIKYLCQNTSHTNGVKFGIRAI
jgi:hypothetical protein